MKIGLIGATNAGKSTLFNRLIGQFRAIVTDIPGTTTDIIHHNVTIDDGEILTFFDSPGLLDFTDELPYIEQIVQESDLLLFVVDDTIGFETKEHHILDLIRKDKKTESTILIVNKLDVKRKEHETDLALSDYYSHGFKEVIGISAKNERNITKVHAFVEKFHKKRLKISENAPENNKTLTNKENISLAILGKPNAGKSTLLNNLVGKPLAKVADFAGTTRDYIAGEFIWGKKHFIAYDTAGIKKKSQIHSIEKIAYDKTKAMLQYIRPVVVFMLDCTAGITHRDLTLLDEVHDLALPMIFVLNKVDLVNPKIIDGMIANAQKHLDFAKYIPIVPMIATQGKGIDEMMKMILALNKENQKRILTRELNETLQSEMLARPPRFNKSQAVKILYATQVAVDAPTFILFVNHKSRVNFAFKKRVENSIRKHYGFVGVPLVIKYKNRDDKDDKNLLNNKGKTKRELIEKHSNTEVDQVESSIHGEIPDIVGHETKPRTSQKTAISRRKPPKRISKYTNHRAGKQGKISDMFTEVYGKPKKKK